MRIPLQDISCVLYNLCEARNCKLLSVSLVTLSIFGCTFLCVSPSPLKKQNVAFFSSRAVVVGLTLNYLLHCKLCFRYCRWCFGRKHMNVGVRFFFLWPNVKNMSDPKTVHTTKNDMCMGWPMAMPRAQATYRRGKKVCIEK